jgi:hypothetical protein
LLQETLAMLAETLGCTLASAAVKLPPPSANVSPVRLIKGQSEHGHPGVIKPASFSNRWENQSR